MKNPLSLLQAGSGATTIRQSPECGLSNSILANCPNDGRRFAMLCPTCQAQARRFGYDRNGNQRFQCCICRRTFSPARDPSLDARRIPRERVIFCLRLLLEGNSIRSTERLTETHRDTIIALMAQTGERCQGFLERELHGLPVEDVQADEIWGFIGCKEKTRTINNYAEWFGDAYCFTAIERSSKLLIAWHLGKRSPEDTRAFAEKLARATAGRFQLTTDGYRPYVSAIPAALGSRVDHARLVKVYGYDVDADKHYSPPQVIDVVATPSFGSPDMDDACTSHVERANLSIRMAVRRMTRLTNAFSKKWENHEAALALFFAYYNFCRPHMTLTEEMGYKCTPAMKAGLAGHLWSVAELQDRIAGNGNGSTH